MHIPLFAAARRHGMANTVLDEPAEPVRSAEDRLTEVEVADQYNLKRKTLQKWRWIERGPPFERLGRKILYRRGDVDAWLLSSRVEPRRKQ